MCHSPLCLRQKIIELFEKLHSHRVLHNDLKNCNIRRRDDGTLAIVDFEDAIYIEDDSPARVRAFADETQTLKDGLSMGSQSVTRHAFA